MILIIILDDHMIMLIQRCNKANEWNQFYSADVNEKEQKKWTTFYYC